ncbi:HNH endonuclease family protein [Isoptericola sp. NPDC056578]|uniref:HNH endonuclease family protein n=1 Tax=Isoptericola sp. NPDC056578 TaxID=3345870 RepID=UPI0036BE4AF6
MILQILGGALVLIGLWRVSQLVPGTTAGEPDPGVEAPLMTEPLAKNAAASVTTARAELEDLDIKGRAPKTGYDREQFGDGWADLDDDGCHTRDEILRRDLTDITLEAGSDCVVDSGQLKDPYTGTGIDFTRGQDTSTAVQIDHVVALSDAWQKGAQQWTAATRERFANDPANLLAVDGPTNAAKSDGDAATWLPPHKAFRCEYVATQVHVKAEYALWVTPAEHDAAKRVLDACHALAPTH